MENLLGVAGFLIAGAATPGPNNLVVWHAASHRGFAGALPAMAGVVLGGLVLLALATSSVNVVSIPGLRTVLTVVGCMYLAWLGIGLIASPTAGNHGHSSARRKLPEGFAGLFLFQFLNPKGWVLMATIASAMSASSRVAAYTQTALLFLTISAACLTLWAVLGSVFATTQRRMGHTHWFERSMGGLLIGSAVLLLLGK